MKVLLYGKNADSIRDLVVSKGFEVVVENPEIVISYGGDGTLLASERAFPGVTKLPIRDSLVCKQCPDHETEHLLDLLIKNQLKPKILPKLEAKFKDLKLLALNDVVIRNANQVHAARFALQKNGEKVIDLAIGDGIVAATPFGSTGYFRSISKTSFDEGFKLVFNNMTQDLTPFAFNDQDKITFELVRGPALLSVDNYPEIVSLHEEDQVTTYVSRETAEILSPGTLRCSQCVISKERRLKAGG